MAHAKQGPSPLCFGALSQRISEATYHGAIVTGPQDKEVSREPHGRPGERRFLRKQTYF